MATDIQPIQDILTRWILIGQALVGSIGALAFVVAFLWTKIGRFKARTCVWNAYYYLVNRGGLHQSRHEASTGPGLN